ncbi:hypothetical protein [Pseudomonas sp. Ps21-P2]|uniref:DUF7706 family protein n=1 Tax=Pseudomonas sp. Ps21-P2 TaxID=3080331 RepID=UPI00320A2269
MSSNSTTSGDATMTIATVAGVAEEIAFSEAEAFALAQFVNRQGWAEFSASAADEAGAFLVKQSVDKLQDLMTRAGFLQR